MFRRISLVVFILLFISLLSFSIYVSIDMKNWAEFDPNKIEHLVQSTVIYDSNDNKLIDIHGVQNRINVSISQVPDYVKNAFIAVEDIRFYKHKGIDIRRMFGALIQNIRLKSYAQGASTITQQVVRNSHLTMKKTISRKLQEIYLALILDRNYSKDQILQTYLNIIYFGGGTYGIETASNTYFNKSAKDLTIAEACLLAGIPKNPSKYSPFADREASLKRKDLIIDLMVKYDFISESEGIEAKNQPIELNDREKIASTNVEFGYFIDRVLEEAKQILGVDDNKLYTDGYRIYTTMDRELQEFCQRILDNDSFFPTSPNSSRRPEGALISIQPSTGKITCLIGGRSYPEDQRKILNRSVHSRRQPGSTIKPLISFAPALEYFGYTPATIIDDSPININGYSPSNFGNKYRGPVTMREGLALSINTVAVKILHDINVYSGISFAEKLGITFSQEDHNNLAIALGGFSEGVTPLELARAYATLADGGIYKDVVTIRRIEDNRGIVLYEHSPIKKTVVSQETAFLINDMLKSTVTWGTASILKDIGIPIAAKTGTAQLPRIQEFEDIDGVKDAWIVAYNPDLVICIWMGFDRTNREDYMPSSAVGGTYPARIAREVLKFAYRDKEASDFIKPSKILEVELDAKSLKEQGKLLLANSLTPTEYIYREFFTAQTAPKNTTDYWTVPSPPEDFRIYSEGLRSPMLTFIASSPLAIYSIYRVDRDTGEQTIVHEVKASSNQHVVWFDETAVAGGNYRYFIIPSHPEILIDNKPIEGQISKFIDIDLPKE